MSLLPSNYDDQFRTPEPEGMHGVMGSDPNRYEFDTSVPQEVPQTEANRRWRQRLDDACKEIK